ncbi:MAG TPA: hypothetical protein DEQ43_03960, partial [Nocardioides bacterium]|nr:hypothetical protein [Nocardioides sp.]
MLAAEVTLIATFARRPTLTFFGAWTESVTGAAWAAPLALAVVVAAAWPASVPVIRTPIGFPTSPGATRDVG